LLDRVARINPAKALMIVCRLAEFVLPRLAKSEVGVTLQPDTSGIFSGTPITAESAAAAYAAIMGAPVGTDLSRIVFEVPVAAPRIEADEPSVEAVPEPIEAEPLSDDYHIPTEPCLEPEALPDNVTDLARWERLGR
jgi:hypothetical protein